MFCAQNICAVRKLAGTHALKQLPAFFGGPVSVGAFSTGLGQAAAGLADFLRALAVDIGQALVYQVQPPLIKCFKIVRGIALVAPRSEEHTSELQSRGHLVCRLLLEKKKQRTQETSEDASRRT